MIFKNLSRMVALSPLILWQPGRWKKCRQFKKVFGITISVCNPVVKNDSFVAFVSPRNLRVTFTGNSSKMSDQERICFVFNDLVRNLYCKQQICTVGINLRRSGCNAPFSSASSRNLEPYFSRFANLPKNSIQLAE